MCITEENLPFRWVVGVRKPDQVLWLSMRQMNLEGFLWLVGSTDYLLQKYISLKQTLVHATHWSVSNVELGSILWKSLVECQEFTKKTWLGNVCKSTFSDNFCLWRIICEDILHYLKLITFSGSLAFGQNKRDLLDSNCYQDLGNG